MDTTNMTASQIDEIKVNKEKELQKAENALHEVELRELELAKEITVMQARRKDLQIALSKGKHIVKTLKLDISILVSNFWRTKDNR